MKVLLLNLTGNTGSTGKIVTDLSNYLRNQGETVWIGYGRGLRIADDKYFKFCYEWEAKCHSLLCKFGRGQYQGLTFPTLRVIQFIKKHSPDIVHLHCLNGFSLNLYMLLKFLAANNIKTVITHHAEFYYTGVCAHAYDCLSFSNSECRFCKTPNEATFNHYFANPHADWEKMKATISRFKKNNLIFTAVSPWVRERSLLSPIVNKYDCKVVYNGINTKVFKHNTSVISKKGNKKKTILHVTASFNDNQDSNKGGWYLIQLARQLPDIQFVVAAAYTSIKGPIPDNVRMYGKAKSQEDLASLYNDADLTLITSKRETFSMVVAESLCCGTPVVGFKAGGPESISIRNYSTFVEWGNIELLKDAILCMLENKQANHLISQEAQQLYSYESMGLNYHNMYKDIISK